MKAAMQYQNKTPEEIVRQYKKRLRAKQGLLILIFLLYVIVGIRGIWWGDDGMPDVLLKLFHSYCDHFSNQHLDFLGFYVSEYDSKPGLRSGNLCSGDAPA